MCSNKVFIATSIDGYIADKDGDIGWLDTIPEINTIDTGFAAFMERVDALVMGRSTFEKVLSFGIDWPYTKPVFVASHSIKEVPIDLDKKVHLVNGPVGDIVNDINNQGYHNLYIDGGKLIQSFLQKDLIDEMIITTIPIILGDGSPLFSVLDHPLQFECVETKLFLDKIVQCRFVRNENATI